MKAQSHGEHAGTEAYVVIDPVRRTAVFMQSGHMRAYPDADVSERIKASCLRIWFVLIDRRCPINGHATQDEAKKDWHVQPVAAPHQQVVPANYTHAGFTLRRARSVPFFVELHGTGHNHSRR
jgi:hypothetical protein